MHRCILLFQQNQSLAVQRLAAYCNRTVRAVAEQDSSQLQLTLADIALCDQESHCEENDLDSQWEFFRKKSRLYPVRQGRTARRRSGDYPTGKFATLAAKFSGTGSE